MEMTLQELLGVMQAIKDSEILEHVEPEKVKVTLWRFENGGLAAGLSGDEWRD